MIRSLTHLIFFFFTIILLLFACIGICFAFHAPAIALNKTNSPQLFLLFPIDFLHTLLFSFLSHLVIFYLLPSSYLPPSSSPPLLYATAVLKATHLLLPCCITLQWLQSPEQIRDIPHSYLSYCSVLCIQCQCWVG